MRADLHSLTLCDGQTNTFAIMPTRHFVFLSAFTIAAASVMWSQTPQTPPPPRPPVPSVIQTPPVQDVEPPEPQSGQGVNLTVRVIDGSTGQPLSGAAAELKRILPTPSRGATPNTADRRRWS